MTRKDIITAIKGKGYNVEAMDVTKNNVKMQGVRFLPKKTVAPVVYVDRIIEQANKTGKTVEEVADEIITVYEAQKAVSLQDNISPDYIMERVRIGLQRKTGENIIKRACDLDRNIEQYLYVTVTMTDAGCGSFKLNQALVDSLGMDAAEIWKAAENHTFANLTIENMAHMLGITDTDDEGEEIMPLYVISNTEHYRGAACALDKAALEKFAKDHHTKQVILIPASVHEMIIIPQTENIDIDDMTAMVQAVNGSEVDPVEQLADKAYIINF